jgi:hypothetical protein
VEFGFRRGFVVVLPGVPDDVVGGPQVLLDRLVEERRVAVGYVEFDNDRATDLHHTSCAVG